MNKEGMQLYSCWEI